MTVLKVMLFAMLMGFPAMVLHECGHIAAARSLWRNGEEGGDLVDWAVSCLRESGPRWANVLISFSGPLVNLLLASYVVEHHAGLRSGESVYRNRQPDSLSQIGRQADIGAAGAHERGRWLERPRT